MRPSTRRRRSVPVGLDPDLAVPRSGARPASAWRVAELAPGGDRVGTVEEQRPVDERGVVVVAHPRLLGERRRRPAACRTSASTAAASWIGCARAGGARDQGRIDVGQRAGVRGRVDPQVGVGPLEPRPARAARSSSSMRSRARGGRSPRPAPGGASRTSGHASAVEHRAVQARTASASASVVENDQHAGRRRAPPGTSRTGARRTRRDRESRRLELREVLGRRASRSESRTNRRSSAEAIR